MSSARSTCQWCNQRPIFSRSTQVCSHGICRQCLIFDKKCQSDCPLCWYFNGSKFLLANKICCVCCNGIDSGDKTFKCNKGDHVHCSKCYADGCILCQFRKIDINNTVIYRNLNATLQRILYVCHIWELKFEEMSLGMINNDKLNDQDDVSPMDVDDTEQLVPGQHLSHHQVKQSSTNEMNNDCMICLEKLGSSYRKLEVCGHLFHNACIIQWFNSNGKQSCPSCGYVYGINKGSQPSNGRMTWTYISTVLPGFENEKYLHNGEPTIEITYSFPSGIQGSLNPNPGKSYSGTSRKAYLPNNREGNEILNLLKRAFDDQHIFTIGRSTTTGQDNVITWNDIHHKTNIYGGSQRFGYPDPTYLLRVRQELADKGYK